MVAVMDKDITKQSGSKIIKKILRNGRDEPAYRSALSLTDEQTFTESIYEAMKLNHGITEFTVIENDAAVGFMTRTAKYRVNQERERCLTYFFLPALKLN
jgi:hypothetical protein